MSCSSKVGSSSRQPRPVPTHAGEGAREMERREAGHLWLPGMWFCQSPLVSCPGRACGEVLEVGLGTTLSCDGAEMGMPGGAAASPGGYVTCTVAAPWLLHVQGLVSLCFQPLPFGTVWGTLTGGAQAQVLRDPRTLAERSGR